MNVQSEIRNPKSEIEASEIRNFANPKLLILETSGRVAHIALADGTGLGEMRTLDESRRHGRDLAPTIASLCSGRGWSVRDIDAVIASIGPGSYTGLRVGLMSAKVLAYATGCVVLGIETFAAIANQTPAGVDRVAVIADAQQQQVYAQTWSRNGDEWTPITRLMIRPFADWFAGLDEGIWISGPAVRLFESQWTDRNPRVPPEWCDPMPASLLKLGLKRWRAEEFDDPAALEPLYLRPSNAEENWDKRGKTS